MSVAAEDSLVDSTIQNRKSEYQEYGYRYIIMGLFSLASFVSGMCWVVVSSISVQISAAYEVSEAVISIIPMSYLIVYVFINFPSNWVLDVKGIKKGIVTGSVLTALGAGIRCFVRDSIYFVIFGQIICAIAQPFLLNAPTKIAVRWFAPKNRSVALAVLAVVNIIGTAVGFLIPPLFVQSASDSPTASSTDTQFTELLLFQFFLTLIPAVLIIFFFREKPKTMPSLGSMMESTQFTESVKTIFTDRKSLTMCFSFGTVMGSFCIYGSLLDNILDPFGFTNDDVSYLAATMMGTGILSAGLLGAYVEKTLNYKRIFRVLGAIGVLQCIALPLFLKTIPDNFVVAILIMILQGIVFIPLMPLSFDYLCQVMFPIGEAQITGILMSSGQVLGTIFIVISQQGLGLGQSGNKIQQNQNASFYTTVIVGATTAVGVLFYCFYDSELKRSNVDKNEGKGSEVVSQPIERGYQH